MLTYKNFDIVPGISTKLEFDLVDDTFIKLNLTGYNFKLEVLNKDLSLRYSTNAGFTTVTGKVTRVLTESETLSIGSGQYQYRLVIKDPSEVSTLSYKGFFTCSEPTYSEFSSANNINITLPDGSIYITSPSFIALGTWYSVTNYQRILVSGVGRLGLDLRSNIGLVQVSSEYFTNTVGDEIEWTPYVGQNSSFRLTQIFGANTVRYLP